MGNISNSLFDTVKTINIKHGIDIIIQKQKFVQQCENAKIFIVDSATTSFQGFYQKCFNDMMSFTDRSYAGLIDKLFNYDFPNFVSTSLNVTRYIFLFRLLYFLNF